MTNFTGTQGWQPQGNQAAPKKDKAPAIKVNATAMWAQLTTVNAMSGKYQIDLTQLSDKAVEALQGLSIEVRYSEDKGNFITTKSSREILAYDNSGNLINDSVGNGSKVQATISPYAWTYQSKSGVSPSLNRLVVTDLVIYSDDTDAELEEAF